MADANIERTSRSARIVLAIIAPLCVLALAFVLWWISDRLLYVGPLDRAAFGWIVVVPTWLAAAPAAAVVWAKTPVRERRLAAVILAATIGLIVAIVYWLATVSPACEFGTIWRADAVAVRGLMLGAIVGSGPALAGLAGATLGRDRLAGTVVLATASGVGMALISLFVLATFLMIPACQRPPAG